MGRRYVLTQPVICRAESLWEMLPTGHPAWQSFRRYVCDPVNGLNPNIVMSARTFTDHGQQLWSAYLAGRESVTVKENTGGELHVA